MERNVRATVEGGAAALLTLAAGGSKVEAAMAGAGQAIATKLLGRLGLVAGLAVGATKSLLGMVQAWAKVGGTAAARMETVQNQLRIMLKGLDAARQRVRELREFGNATPFKLPDVVQGNRALQSLSRGALTTKGYMTMVGDAASQAGTSFQDMAVYVGRLYDGLSAGRPVGEVLFRLAELGVISGEARTAIERLQESGASFDEVWRIVTRELNRSQGTMAYTAKTAEGLSSTLEDTIEDVQAAFSERFLEGQKEAIQANIQALENLRPAVEGLGDGYSQVVNVTSTLTAKTIAWITSLPGAATALELVGRMAGVAAAGMMVLLTYVGGRGLAAALPKLITLLRGSAIAASLFGRAVALMVGPLGLLVLAVTAGIALWSRYSDQVARAAEAVREYRGETDALVASLQAQRAAVKTLDNLAAAYNATLEKLKGAILEEARLVAKMGTSFQGERGDGERLTAAAERIEVLKKELMELDKIQRSALEKSPIVADNEAAVAAQERAVKQAEIAAARQTMSPLALQESYRREADELAQRRERAQQENAGIETHRMAKSQIGADLAKNKVQQAEVQGQMSTWLGVDGAKYDALARELERLKKVEEELMMTELRLGDAQSSQIVKLQERLSLWAKYESQAAAVAAAETALAEASKIQDEQDRAKAVAEATAALKMQRQALEQLKKVTDSMNWTPAEAQQAAAELARLKDQLRQDLLNKPDETAARAAAEQQRRQREKTNKEAGDAAILARMELDHGALAVAQAQLDIEREKLELARQNQEIDEHVYKQNMIRIEAEEKLLKMRRESARRELEGDNAAGMFDIQAKVARFKGKGKEALDLEEQAERAREEARRADRVREIMDRAGLNEADAKKQAEAEIERARMGRALDREGGLLSALMGQKTVTDSLQRIGGGGSAYGGGDIDKVVARLDRLIDAVKGLPKPEVPRLN